jgi:NADPH:quinone reductase-like Zn-dependent oxidoreductase
VKGEGSWQEYVSVREEFVWPVPDTISDAAAAQFVINPWTVYGMLSDLQVPKGEYVLQTAAGSVLGRQVIQLAKHWGIKTINVVRRAEQKQELLDLGADEVICSNDEDVVARVIAIAGKKLAWGALDCVAGEMTKKVMASVRWGGQVFVYGVLSSFDASIAITDLFRGVRISGWILYNQTADPAKRQEYIQAVSKLLEEKVLVPLEGQKYELADFKAAIGKSEEVGRGGKVLLSSL